MYSKRHLPDIEQWSQSSGSNVITRRAHPGLAGLRPHMNRGGRFVVFRVSGSRCRANSAQLRQPRPDSAPDCRGYLQPRQLETFDRLAIKRLTDRVGWLAGGVPREQKMLKGHLPRVIYHQVYSNMRRLRPATKFFPLRSEAGRARTVRASTSSGERTGAGGGSSSPGSGSL